MNCVRKSLEDITQFLTRHRALVDSHMVNFFTHRLWEVNVPLNIRKEVENISAEEILEDFICFDNSEASHNENASRFIEVNKFVDNARSLYLTSFTKCLDLNELLTLMDGWGCVDCNIILDQSFMSLKKAHEVQIMSSVVASMFKALNCSHVVDVGGGKGYLSSVLCLEHKLKVLGLDSSSSNTNVATKRTEKMQKAWSGIRKRIENGGLSKRKGKHWKAKLLSNSSSKNNIDENFSKKDVQIEGEEPNNLELAQLELNVTNFDSNINDNIRLVDTNFKQVTHFVNHNSNLYDIVKESYKDVGNLNLALVGLHTCGNLASSCLKLFVDNKNTEKDCARLLVNVGCCYHLLTEKYPGLPSVKQSKIVQCCDCNNSDESGFPLSSYLCSKKFTLSYNSRVLSSQPIERISKCNKSPSSALFYRALFEVILERNLTDYSDKNVYSVGRIKCSNFTEYVFKAIKKLGLQFEISEAEINNIYEEYYQYIDKLKIYFMMRVTLAPLVEAVILLDRLLYLYENGIEDAYLVQLFNPVLSPRCYGIIAFRN